MLQRVSYILSAKLLDRVKMTDEFNDASPQWDDLRKCPRQREVLNEILDAASNRRLPPTSGELATKFHIARARAYSTLERLLEKGYIEWGRTSKHVSRAVRGVMPTRKAWIWRFSQETTTDPDFRHIPVIGEGVGAGNARVPYEDVREYLPLPARHLHNAEANAFILQVSGDSMMGDDGVFPDDYVVVVPDINPRDGDMAVVIADGQEYIKRL